MRYLSLLIVLFFSFLFISVTNAQEKLPTELYFFYGQGCPHCAAMDNFLEGMQAKYPELIIKKYETYSNQQNLELFGELSDAYGKDIQGVPTTFIDDKVIVGFSNSIGSSVESEIVRCLEVGCGSPEDKLKIEEPELQEVLHIVGESDPVPVSQKVELMQKITIPAILSA
ncbi:hypothetical protein KKG46_03735, partial [Patescibacteria group bacterium]|nr:hypothetical protein [Patescibacteria group bacterium]